MKTALTTIAITATFANAGLTYQSQGRSITAGAHLPNGQQSETISSNGFDDFNEIIDRGFSDIDGGAWGMASQDSSFHQFGMAATGAAGGSWGPPAGSSAGFGYSYFAVDFTIDEATEYTLDFSYSGDSSSFSFTGTSLNHSGNDIGINISESGTLQAGAYSFVLDFGVGAAFFEGSYDFSFQVVPAPASTGLMAIGLLAATRRRRC